jgi:hypothetical protein
MNSSRGLQGLLETMTRHLNVNKRGTTFSGEKGPTSDSKLENLLENLTF